MGWERPRAFGTFQADVDKGNYIPRHLLGCPEFDLEAGGGFDAVDRLGRGQGFLDLAILRIGGIAIDDEFGSGLGP